MSATIARISSFGSPTERPPHATPSNGSAAIAAALSARRSGYIPPCTIPKSAPRGEPSASAPRRGARAPSGA